MGEESKWTQSPERLILCSHVVLAVTWDSVPVLLHVWWSAQDILGATRKNEKEEGSVLEHPDVCVGVCMRLRV